MPHRKAVTHRGQGLVQWFSKKHGLPLNLPPYALKFCNIPYLTYWLSEQMILGYVGGSNFGKEGVPSQPELWGLRGLGLAVWNGIIRTARPDKTFGRLLNAAWPYPPKGSHWNGHNWVRPDGRIWLPPTKQYTVEFWGRDQTEYDLTWHNPIPVRPYTILE